MEIISKLFLINNVHLGICKSKKILHPSSLFHKPHPHIFLEDLFLAAAGNAAHALPTSKESLHEDVHFFQSRCSECALSILEKPNADWVTILRSTSVQSKGIEVHTACHVDSPSYSHSNLLAVASCTENQCNCKDQHLILFPVKRPS